MNFCPNAHDLQLLLADRLPDDVRTSVEGHVEACPACQGQLDALTQAAELKLATSHVAGDRGPEFLERLQAEYPETLLNGMTATSATLHFPGASSERAPLGQLDDFDILEELGSGSFGWVFRARERSLNRIVALKVLKPEMTVRPDAIVRFEREARKASLQHDHIVQVHGIEKPAGFPPYIVMEFVDGETLEAKLKREGKLTPEEAAAIARQVALGLAAAHEHGMVHRDIKPANILLDKKTGRAKISDFGLARDVANESLAVTNAGEMAGTTPYMSPEHFQAPEKVDGRSDVFSLGVVLYQLLTGKLPFTGSFLQIRSAILEDEPTSPRRLNDSIPVDLETITLACLQKAPIARYATAQAVAEDLRRYQNGEPILCRPTGQVERAVKWMQRKPAQAALVGVGTITLFCLTILIIGVFFNAHLQGLNTELGTEKEKVQKANVNLQTVNIDLKTEKDKVVSAHVKLTKEEAAVRRLSYVADMNLAYQAFQSDNFVLLEQYLAAYQESDLRGFEWHYLRWLANTDGRRIGPKEPVTAVAVDKTGRFLALGVMVGKEAQWQLWATPNADKPRGELLQKSVAQPNKIVDLAFHPKGEWLVTSDGGGTSCVWDIKKNAKAHTIPGFAPLAVSSDGAALAYIRPDGHVQRWGFTQKRDIGEPLPFEVPGVGSGDKSKAGSMKPRVPDRSKLKGTKGEEPAKPRSTDVKTPSGPVLQLAFSHDGQHLAAVGGRYAEVGALVVWNLKTGQRVMLDEAQPNDLLASVTFNPDGQSIAAAGYDHALRVWDLKTGKLRFRQTAHKLEVLSVAANAKGDLLATAGWDKAVKIWNSSTGEEQRNLRGSRGVVTQVAFCPDPKDASKNYLVSLNEFAELRWWDAEQEQTARVTEHRESVHALAFSPKGRYLASFGKNSQVVIQDLVETKPAVAFETLTPLSFGLFSRDESTLFTADNEFGVRGWPVANGSKPFDHKSGAVIASQRFVTAENRQWRVSQPFPSANNPVEIVASFGPVPMSALAIIAVDAAGERFAFADDERGVVLRRRDKQTGKLIEHAFQVPGATKASQAVNALAFSPDGRFLAVGNQDNSILLWDTESRTLKHHLTGHLCFVSCVAFSPDGKRLVSGSEDWTVKIWDIEAGRATLTLSGHKGRIRDLAFSPDGKLLASASEDKTVRIWPGVLESTDDRWERRGPSSSIQRGSK